MNPLRSLFDDLRRKRLMPVALLLLVAAVAIPVVIGGGGSDSGAADPVAVPVPGPAEDARPAVSLVGPAEVRTRAGKVRDPFRRTGSKTAAQAVKPASSAKPSAPRESAASIAARSVYVTTARFRAANHNYVHPLEFLDVFGAPESPALQYVGVADGGEYAVFVLGPAATASDDAGVCIVADPCRAIGLRKGEKLRVSVAFPGAATRHYTLEVRGLRRVKRSSAAVARVERSRTDRRGRRVLNAIKADAATGATLGQLRYSRRSGTVALVAAP